MLLSLLLATTSGATPHAAAKITLEAVEFDSPVFNRIGKGRHVAGYLRRGALVQGDATGEDCAYSGTTGEWYMLGEGVVCSGKAFKLNQSRKQTVTEADADGDQGHPVPYSYARVVENQVPRLSRSGNVAEVMEGDFFLAIPKGRPLSGRLAVTARDEMVDASKLTIKPPSDLGGIQFANQKLAERPHVFVLAEGAQAYRSPDAKAKPCGERLRAYDRFEASAVGEWWIEIGGTHRQEACYVRREETRVSWHVAAPDEVGASEKWIHVNLGEQVLSAYEGERRVFTTLIASGKEGHETPTGVFRVNRKFRSKLMRGTDPVEGIYHVEEVPWTMFYHGGYALHGAYWHDGFGKVRSHGCTNIAPSDAKWLFDWEPARIPTKWHAATVDDGALVWFQDQVTPEQSRYGALPPPKAKGRLR